MKTRKLRLICALITIALSIGMVYSVLACSSPQSGYGTYISPGTTSDTATSYIYACSCSPRNNYLRASLRVQKMDSDGGPGVWYPSLTTYLSTTTQNGSSAVKTMEFYRIYWAYGQFYARCSVGTTGIQDGLTDYDYR
jgi:hypothetical protein